MDVVRYSLVHWEQLMGEPPSILPTVTSVNEPEGIHSFTIIIQQKVAVLNVCEPTHYVHVPCPLQLNS